MRLQQILLNLVGNAIKFTETGTIRLSARVVEARNGAGPWLAIDVQDTGIGLTPEQMDRLFKPFSRVDSSTSRQQGGAGLGLNISRKLAELLGGTVSVASHPGVGSTFTALVTTGSLEGVERVPLGPQTRSALPVAETNAASEHRLEGRILLVDDGADNRRLVRLILSRAGASVDLAEDGREACIHMVDALATGPRYDLVLMDMQMPVLDGYQTTGEMRRMGYHGPIVALTAHAMAGDRERCLAAGCDEYATKPVNRHELLEICSRLLRPLDAIPGPLPSARSSSPGSGPAASPARSSDRTSASDESS
jgi:CheY-like chemotaxis protein